jgi:hypothetical protein
MLVMKRQDAMPLPSFGTQRTTQETASRGIPRPT